jgi:hypothetical protein
MENHTVQIQRRLMYGKLNIHPILFQGYRPGVATVFPMCPDNKHYVFLITEILRQLFGIKIPKWN